MYRRKKEIKVRCSKLQMKFIFFFWSLTPPRNIIELWNTVLSRVLFKFSSLINCLENLVHWRQQGYIVVFFFSCLFLFSVLEMPRGEIVFVLTHCTLISHLTANTTITQNVIILSITPRYYLYFSL